MTDANTPENTPEEPTAEPSAELNEIDTDLVTQFQKFLEGAPTADKTKKVHAMRLGSDGTVQPLSDEAMGKLMGFLTGDANPFNEFSERMHELTTSLPPDVVAEAIITAAKRSAARHRESHYGALGGLPGAETQRRLSEDQVYYSALVESVSVYIADANKIVLPIAQQLYGSALSREERIAKARKLIELADRADLIAEAGWPDEVVHRHYSLDPETVRPTVVQAGDDNDYVENLTPAAAKRILISFAEMTRILSNLLNPELTSPADYAAFMNVLVEQFLIARVDDTNTSMHEIHAGHDEAECLVQGLGTAPIRTVWKRTFSVEPALDNAIRGYESLSALVTAPNIGEIHACTLSLHPALMDALDKEAANATEEAARTVIDTLKQYATDNPDYMQRAFLDESSAGPGHDSVAHISITSHVLTAPLFQMQRAYDAVFTAPDWSDELDNLLATGDNGEQSE